MTPSPSPLSSLLPSILLNGTISCCCLILLRERNSNNDAVASFSLRTERNEKNAKKTQIACNCIYPHEHKNDVWVEKNEIETMND